MEFLEMENTIIEMKHSANGVNSKTDKTEGNISELKGKAIETIQIEAKDKNTEKDEPVGHYQMFQHMCNCSCRRRREREEAGKY